MEMESTFGHGDLHQQVIQWSRQYLLSIGYALKHDNPESVLTTPWSYVARFHTTNGYIYLKHTPPLIGLESTIIQVLHAEFSAPVPQLVGKNATLHCFLMQDGGRKLRDILKEKFDEALLCKSIMQFTALQILVSKRIDKLIDISVPDWRLEKIPVLFRAIISNIERLQVAGLSSSEINALYQAIPKITLLSTQLSAYGIQETLVQPDCNDNNMLIADGSQEMTLIDLGEISISHPFFSLLNCLQQIEKHYGIARTDAVYLRIKETCLKNYMPIGSIQCLSNALEIANKLWPVYGILALDRLMHACGHMQITEYYPDRLRLSLQEVLVETNRH